MGKRIGIIYGLVDGQTLELRYVGQTTRPRMRLHEHHRRAHPAWNMVVLQRGSSDLNAAEERWIRKVRKQGARLVNVKPTR